MRPGGGATDLDLVDVSPSDVLRGKTYMDREGEPQVGSMPNISTGRTVTLPSGKNVAVFDNVEKRNDTFMVLKADNFTPGYVDRDLEVGIDATKLGDTVAKYVVEGNTFTSKSGVKQTGLMPNNDSAKKSDRVEIKTDSALIRIPSGAYFNGTDGKDPSIELSKATVAKMAADMFGLAVVTNFKLAQLYSSKVSMTWTLSPNQRTSYDKTEFTDTKTRHGLCTGFEVSIISGSTVVKNIVPYNQNTSIYDYTSDIIPNGSVTVDIKPYIRIADNHIVAGKTSSSHIDITNINGNLNISSSQNLNGGVGQTVVPSGVRYMAYVLVGNGGGGSHCYKDEGGDSYHYNCGGGGGGGYFKEGIIRVIPGEVISYKMSTIEYSLQKNNKKYYGPTTVVFGNNRLVLSVENGADCMHVYKDNYGFYVAMSSNGGNGGSGGGPGGFSSTGAGSKDYYPGNGGSDGGNGTAGDLPVNVNAPGTGQGSTTRSRLTGVLYSGGGGGGGPEYHMYTPYPNGGAGGGGNGGNGRMGGTNGTDGLGGGGGGGGNFGAGDRRKAYGGSAGGYGCIYLEWGDRVMEVYKNEILAMERG